MTSKNQPVRCTCGREVQLDDLPGKNVGYAVSYVLVHYTCPYCGHVLAEFQRRDKTRALAWVVQKGGCHDC